MIAIKPVEEKFTIEEYLLRESRSKNKNEYYNGYIKETPGASVYRNLITANVIAALNNCLENKNFLVLTSDTKINISRLQSFVYPDAVVVCEKPQFFEGRTDTITNPLLIVEVFSPSAREHDSGRKFEYYKTLPSFKEYVQTEQSMPWMLASYKTAERTWTDTEALSIEASIRLHSVDCNIPLARIYRHIAF